MLDWGQFFKLAISGMVMLCIEWWSFEVGAFITGSNQSYKSKVDLCTKLNKFNSKIPGPFKNCRLCLYCGCFG